MKVSKRTGTALFFLSLMSSFLVRYPLFKVHSGGFDSEFIFYLSRSLSEYGMAKWVANPSSYFGLHRFSYTLGSVFLYSSFMQAAGTDSEYLILIYDLLIASVMVMAGFLFGLVLRKRDYMFAFLVSFIFGTSPVLVFVSSWTLSARGLFMTIFAALMLVSFSRIKHRKKTGLLILLTIVGFSVHRMAFFLLLTLLPAYLLYSFYEREYLLFPSRSSPGYVRYGIPFIITLSAISMIYLFYYGETGINQALLSYTSGRLISGGIMAVLVNLGVTFVVSGGIPVLFVVSTLFIPARRMGINRNMFIIVIYTLFSFSFLFYKDYFRVYASFSLAVLAAFSAILFMYVWKSAGRVRRHRTRGMSIVAIVLAISMIFSIFMQGYWNGAFTERQGDYMDYREEALVIATRDQYGDRIFSTAQIGRLQVAYSRGNETIMPFVKEEDGYYEACIQGYIGPGDLHLVLKPRFFAGRVYLYFPENNTEGLYRVFSNSSFYSHYILKDTDNSTFVHDMRENCYVTYENSLYSWDVRIYYADMSNPKIRDKDLYIH